MRTLALAILLLFCGLSASATTYYIDYAAGADTNNGTAKGTPFKRAPGMVGCANTCASTTPAPGDSIILKGGVSWPNAVFPMTFTWSGTNGNPIYIGVDVTWFTGGSFTRPIFNAAGTRISGTYNVFFDLHAGGNYLTVDNIEWTGFASTISEGYGDCAVIQAADASTGLLIENNYFHNFSVGIGGNCFVVMGTTFSAYEGSSVVKNNVFAGDGLSMITAVLCFGTVQNNVVHDMPGMIYPCGHGDVSGNLMYNCGYPSFPTGTSFVHGDAIQSDVSDGTFYIHDNVIHDTGNDVPNSSECESMLIGNPSETDYVWNNVLYNINGNAISLIQNVNPGVAAYIWNNTVLGGQTGTAYCVRAGHSGTWPILTIQNNHCVSSASQTDDPSLAASTKTVSNNVIQSISTASGQGFTTSQSFVYSPTLGTNSTVGAGTDLTSNCSGGLAGLCTDTTYACTVNGSNAVSCPDRTAGSRPASGAWDAGAYEFGGASPNPCHTCDISALPHARILLPVPPSVI